jgi:hypothetical protein
MKQILISSLIACVGLALLSALARAQGSATTPSLGDLARELRAERAKENKKPRLFTNDDLPKRPAEDTLTMSTDMSETPAEPKQATPGEPKEKAVSSAKSTTESSDKDHGEEYYRARMKELRERLELHQRELSVLQQKLNQNDMQFYTDPNKMLQEQYSRADINKVTQEIKKKKDQVAADEKAIDDLRDKLRREGGDPGWLR